MASYIRSLFTKHLFATNVIATGGLLSLGDVITQGLEITYDQRMIDKGTSNKKKCQEYDWSRTGRMLAIGLFLGPANHFWYTKWIEKVVGANAVGMKGTIKRMLADQLIASPYFDIVFFFGMGVLEGKGAKGGLQEVKDKMPTVYMIEWLVWPPVQFINFYFLPNRARVIYVCTMTLIWNTFLSWYKHKDQSHLQDSKLKNVAASVH